MKLSTRMRYGTRALLDLALYAEQGPTPLRDIAERQQLSPKYLEQVLVALQTADLVRAVRGPKGGYVLSRPPARINLREAYEVLEGSEGFVRCTTDPKVCARASICVAQEVWASLYETCMKALESITLEDLAQRARQKQSLSADEYYI